MSDVSELLISLKSDERCEQIAQVAHQNERPWAIRSEEMSDRERYLKSLTKNEQMSESLIFWANLSFFEQIAHSLIFDQKTSNLLGNQMSEFPALITNHVLYSISDYKSWTPSGIKNH